LHSSKLLSQIYATFPVLEIRMQTTDQTRSFERGEIGFRDLFVSGEPSESFDNVAYTLRFMIDLNIVGMNWVEIKAGRYSIRSPNTCISRCQIEVDCQCVYLLH